MPAWAAIFSFAAAISCNMRADPCSFGRVLPGQIFVLSSRCDGDSNAKIVDSINEPSALLSLAPACTRRSSIAAGNAWSDSDGPVKLGT